MGKYYSDKEIKNEQEANAFACYLLMPEFLFLPELLAIRKKTNDDALIIKHLSKVFEVPEHAVANRITLIDKVKIFRPSPSIKGE